MTNISAAPDGAAPVDAPVDGAAPIVDIAEVVTDAPAAVEPTDTEVSPASDTEPAPSPVETPAAEPSAIEGATDQEGEKPVDASTEGALPTYEDWTIPEGLEMQPEQTTAFNEVIGKYNLSQEAGQELIEFGSGLIKQSMDQYAAQLAQQQQDQFAETRRGWVKEFETAAGNRRNTILDDAKSAIRDAVPDEKARAELWDVLAFTGAGDHPAVINTFAAIGRKSRERGAPSKPIATNVPQNPAERRYGKSG